MPARKNSSSCGQVEEPVVVEEGEGQVGEGHVADGVGPPQAVEVVVEAALELELVRGGEEVVVVLVFHVQILEQRPFVRVQHVEVELLLRPQVVHHLGLNVAEEGQDRAPGQAVEAVEELVVPGATGGGDPRAVPARPRQRALDKGAHVDQAGSAAPVPPFAVALAVLHHQDRGQAVAVAGREPAGQQGHPLDHVRIEHAHRAAEQLEAVRVEDRHPVDDDEVLVGAAAAHVELAGEVCPGHHPRQGVERAEQVLAPSGHLDHLERFDPVGAGLLGVRAGPLADDGDGGQLDRLGPQGDLKGGGLAGADHDLTHDPRLVPQPPRGQAVGARWHRAHGEVAAAVGHGPQAGAGHLEMGSHEAGAGGAVLHAAGDGAVPRQGRGRGQDQEPAQGGAHGGRLPATGSAGREHCG